MARRHAALKRSIGNFLGFGEDWKDTSFDVPQGVGRPKAPPEKPPIATGLRYLDEDCL